MLKSGFVLVGCQSDIDCGFYSCIYISTWLNLYTLSHDFACRRYIFIQWLQAPLYTIECVGATPVAPKNRLCTLILLRLLQIFQLCEAERERNGLMPFRYVVVLTKTDLSKWPGDSTLVSLLLEHGHLITRNFHISYIPFNDSPNTRNG